MAVDLLGVLALAAAGAVQESSPPDARALAGRAISHTRRLSYRTRFQARLSAPQGDPIDYKGVSLRLVQGVLYAHYTATGGDFKNIVRVDVPGGPPRVWVWHEGLGDWVTPEEIGSPGIGRGIQNPDELLEVLSRHLDGARLRTPGVVELAFSGEEIGKVMRDQPRAGSFDWAKSRAEIELHVDAETRLRRLVCRADLQPADPEVRGRVKYSAEVEVETYSPEPEMKFFDEDRRPILLRGEIRRAIDAALKER